MFVLVCTVSLMVSLNKCLSVAFKIDLKNFSNKKFLADAFSHCLFSQFLAVIGKNPGHIFTPQISAEYIPH